MKEERGFTLIELLIIIIILGFLTALISGNYITSLQKGRDAKRKNDLAQIQRALETYYEDNKAYPTGAPPFGSRFCSTPSCLAGDKTYMVRTPGRPKFIIFIYIHRRSQVANIIICFRVLKMTKTTKDLGSVTEDTVRDRSRLLVAQLQPVVHVAYVNSS